MIYTLTHEIEDNVQDHFFAAQDLTIQLPEGAFFLPNFWSAQLNY